MPLVVVFGFVFLVMLSGLVSYILFQHRQATQRVDWNQALHAAEAGLQYARWHLAHAPEDFAFDGVYDFKDPEGALIGKYQLDVAAPSGCVPGVAIRSTGWTISAPAVQRTAQVQYVRPSLAQYAFLTNSNVWFGESEELKGPFHSNGGMRMDGEQNSLATSAAATYACSEEHGCSPPETKPGIWGSGQGGQEGLWQFPVSNIDFNAITQDLSLLRDQAQASGIYLGQLGLGYHVKFRNNGTIDVYRIKTLKPKVWGWNMEKWVHESNDIATEEFYRNYLLPGGCSPIFIEDNVWVDGEVAGRATLVAAKLPEVQNNNPKIIINGNIIYANQDSALGLIGQRDILIPLYSPDQLEIRAALLAQKGHVYRYYYPSEGWGEPYETYSMRDSIITYGSIISNAMWTFVWGDEDNNIISGYGTTDMNYDPDLTFSPPPYFPTSGEYEVGEWEEL